MSQRSRQEPLPPMSGHRRRAERKRRRRIGARRAVAVLVAVGLAGVVALLSASAQPGLKSRLAFSDPPARLTIRDRDRVLAVFRLDRFERPDGSFDARRLRAAVRRRIPPRRAAKRGRARVTYRLEGAAAARRAAALGARGGTVGVRRTPVASNIAAPVVRQRLRNICEAAALRVLLATTGVQADQMRVQARIPRSGPLDPQDTASGRVWGDPDLGFVGRPDGGGVAGGFGVYQRPMANVARRYGRALDDLTGVSANRVYRRLRAGRAVMAWVGLSDGPYGEWRSPRGRSVKVNFGEDTVVLVGVRADGALRVVNPLGGTRELWSKDRFEAM